MNDNSQRGGKLSPWTVIKIMARAKEGEPVAALAQEFAVNRATINRWLLKWGHESGIAEKVQLANAVKKVTRRMDGQSKKAMRKWASSQGLSALV